MIIDKKKKKKNEKRKKTSESFKLHTENNFQVKISSFTAETITSKRVNSLITTDIDIRHYVYGQSSIVKQEIVTPVSTMKLIHIKLCFDTTQGIGLVLFTNDH